MIRKRLGTSSLVLVVACADAGSDAAAPTPTAPLICADCVKSAPGQGSASASSSLAGCTLGYLERDVDRDEAESLGFAVSAAQALIETPIDTPVTWEAQNTEAGGPAGGYERETQLRGGFEVESYNYRWLNPERCDGTVCTVDGIAHKQSLCDERILVTWVSGALETLDGAISVRFPAQPVNLRRLGQVDDVVVAAAADLSDTRGRLTIDPEVPPPRVGRVDLSLQFADGQRRGYGVLSVNVYPDWANLPEGAGGSIPSRLAHYQPVRAEWGDPPSGEPGVSGR